jgi:ribosomal protein L22
MSDDRTTEEETAEAEAPEEAPKKPRRRRSRAKAADAAPAPEAAAPSEPEPAEAEPEAVAAPEAQAEPEEAEPEEAEPPVPVREADGVEPVAAAEAEAEAAEEAPAPRRRGRRGAAVAEEPAPATRTARPAGERVLVRAQARYVRTSARKARLVCDHIRGKSVPEARAILAHTPRAVARDWSKLLESAVANAENNHELLGDELRIHAITADEGPTLKRYRPRALGRATRIRKRTSHLTILLTPKEA